MEQTPERLNEMTKEGSVEETQPGKKKRWPFVAAALIGVAVFALIFALTRGDDGLEIQTASGTFVIADVVAGDRYPEGCAEGGPGCDVAMAGYEVLVLELAPQGDAEVERVTSEGKGAYVVSSDGDRTESFLTGWNSEGDSKQAMVGFLPEASDHDFILYWPGNEPVELGR